MVHQLENTFNKLQQKSNDIVNNGDEMYTQK